MNVLKLYEAISNPDSDVEGKILVLDIANSTAMKESQDEASWLVNYAKLFDGVIQCIPTTGHIVKYLGDGLMIFFSTDRQTDAINSAIKMQEAIDDLVERKVISCACAIGIASGSFKKIPLGESGFDYMGLVVDRAFRLCAAAMPKAIFVDVLTIDAANSTRIQSILGKAAKWKPHQYTGSLESLRLKGFSQPVEYHEVTWSNTRFGAKSVAAKPELSGALAEPQRTLRTLRTPEPEAPKGPATLFGRFGGWTEKEGKISGIVTSEDGMRYFCHRGSVAEGYEISAGDEVIFVAVPTDRPLDAASGILPIGARILAKIVNLSFRNAFLSSDVLAKYGHDNAFHFMSEDEISKFGMGSQCYITLTKGFDNKKAKLSLQCMYLEPVAP